jgi:GT2 family glycosyltransferase
MLIDMAPVNMCLSTNGEVFNIAVLMTCYNRKEKTIACLNSLLGESSPDLLLTVYLVDDCSSDGTFESVAQKFPQVRLFRGNGGLFWNRGMHLAFSEALVVGHGFYVWLNDDVELSKNALPRLIQCYKQLQQDSGEVIVVGCMRSRDDQEKVTYGGMRRESALKPTTLKVVRPDPDNPVEVDTMNGNLVLIPNSIALVVGNLDPFYEHAMGDTDYGFRARKKGFRVFAAPGYMGICDRNTQANTFEDASLPLRERWQKVMNPRGLPPRSWLHYTRRHAGPLWPIYFLWPYVRVGLSSISRPRSRGVSL